MFEAYETSRKKRKIVATPKQSVRKQVGGSMMSSHIIAQFIAVVTCSNERCNGDVTALHSV